MLAYLQDKMVVRSSATKSLHQILDAHRKKQYHTETPEWHFDFESLIQRMLEFDPDVRIAPLDALRHAFFLNKHATTQGVAERKVSSDNKMDESSDTCTANVMQDILMLSKESTQQQRPSSCPACMNTVDGDEQREASCADPLFECFSQ